MNPLPNFLYKIQLVGEFPDVRCHGVELDGAGADEVRAQRRDLVHRIGHANEEVLRPSLVTRKFLRNARLISPHS